MAGMSEVLMIKVDQESAPMNDPLSESYQWAK